MRRPKASALDNDDEVDRLDGGTVSSPCDVTTCESSVIAVRTMPQSRAPYPPPSDCDRCSPLP